MQFFITNSPFPFWQYQSCVNLINPLCWYGLLPSFLSLLFYGKSFNYHLQGHLVYTVPVSPNSPFPYCKQHSKVQFLNPQKWTSSVPSKSLSIRSITRRGTCTMLSCCVNRFRVSSVLFDARQVMLMQCPGNASSGGSNLPCWRHAARVISLLYTCFRVLLVALFTCHWCEDSKRVQVRERSFTCCKHVQRKRTRKWLCLILC